MSASRFSDFIIFADETGDHGLVSIDEQFPVFALVFCILFCMEQTLGYLCGQGQTGKLVTVAFESRGKREDAELELEFRRICDNQGNWGYKQTNFQEIGFEHLFVDKKSNATGLQLADLVARPLALRYLRPTQPNRAAEIIEVKVLFYNRFT